mmetsp:Transcript_14542/g.20268  ORF Transcript_14542/g.20268 Transcript_14542/m.20268 type:complete len:200 (-) Transcript_14542:1169-1768(-)
MIWLKVLSSATSTLKAPTVMSASEAFLFSTGSFRFVSSSSSSAVFVLIVKKNVAPLLGSLSTQILPCIASTIRWQIARPSPVPPYFLVHEESTWLNAEKIKSCFSFGMPIPVSDTLNSSSTESSGRGSLSFGLCRDTLMVMWPSSAVNLTALLTRLTSTCRSRVMSPTTIGGTSVSTKLFIWIALAGFWKMSKTLFKHD